MRKQVFARCLATILIASAVAVHAQQKHFMWVVRHAGAPPTYLLGSLHVLTPEYYPLAPAVEQAFKQSKVLVEEVDLAEASNPLTALSLVGTAMLTDGRTLGQIISPALYKQVLARAEKAGLPEIAVERMKPWMVAISLIAPAMKAAGYDPELGVDKHFFDRATAAGLEIRGLETVQYQLGRLDQLSPAMQEAMLKSAISDLDAEVANVKTIAQAWSRGDTSTIERLLLASLMESPELYQTLLVERNRNWVAPIERCMKERTACFVVVGAAHLVGAHSVPNLLRQKGYTVDQQ